jgi:hypothetical protein
MPTASTVGDEVTCYISNITLLFKLEMRRWMLEYQESGVAERGWDSQYLKDSLQKEKDI